LKVLRPRERSRWSVERPVALLDPNVLSARLAVSDALARVHYLATRDELSWRVMT
jgi:hypothetical protein